MGTNLGELLKKAVELRLKNPNEKTDKQALALARKLGIKAEIKIKGKGKK